jgi:hypothetical protein
MEPDRTPLDDEIDDTQVLTAIEHAWPVPPMTGRLLSHEWANGTITPSRDSFAAPLQIQASQQARRLRGWPPITHVAAIVVLLLVSIFSALAVSDQGNSDDQSFSIAAPSPGEIECALPIRSRSELTQIATELKHQSDTGTKPAYQQPVYSVFELTAAPADVAADVNTLLTELSSCAYARVNPIALEATNPESPYIRRFALSIFAQPNISIDEAVDQMLAPYPSEASPTNAEPMPTLAVRMTPSGEAVAMLSADIFGNRYAYAFSPSGDGWLQNDLGLVTGEWSSLLDVKDSSELSSSRCTDALIKGDPDVQADISRLSTPGPSSPLIAEYHLSQIGNDAVNGADADSIQALVQNYRGCLTDLVEPYQFAQITHRFFTTFAAFPSVSRGDISHQLGYSSAIGLKWVTPPAITSIVSIDENTALALLAVNPEWQALGKMPGIILVKQNGQWLINQLAIVQSPSS